MSPEDDCWLPMRVIGMTTRGSLQAINTHSKAGYEHCIEILDRNQDTKGKSSWDLRHGGENGKQQDHIIGMPQQITAEQVETSIVRGSDRKLISVLSKISPVNACRHF